MRLDAKKRERLESNLAEKFGEKVEIANASRISMGQSRAMYVLELTHGPRRRLVLRIEQWGLLGSDSRDEVAVMRALHAKGLPVAEVLHYEPSEDVLGQPFFVMDFVEGTSVYQPESLDPYLDALAALHAADPDTLGLEFFERPQGKRDSALTQIERWYGVYRDNLLGEPSPLVEEAAQWLRNHAPETERVSLVHGDPGPGNYLHVGGELRALVDWEFAHLGDADEDWAFLICIRGAGLMDRDAWVARIAERVGVRLDPERLQYWIAFNLFKGACIDQTALGIYVRGETRAPNLLAIGTCVHLSALKQLAQTLR
jgi:aminoglycoside phosphotransferase (APT) family kinase protein